MNVVEWWNELIGRPTKLVMNLITQNKRKIKIICDFEFFDEINKII